MTIDIETLIKQADEYHRSVEPEEVDVTLGEQIVTLRISYIMPTDFTALMGIKPLVTPADFAAGYSHDAVARAYPKVAIVDGDEVDELRVIRGEGILYRWPEVYDALSIEDRRSVQAAIYGMHIYIPERRKEQIGASGV